MASGEDTTGTSTRTLGIPFPRLSGKTVDEGGVVSHDFSEIVEIGRGEAFY